MTISPAHGVAIIFVSRVSKSAVSSWKGFPISFITLYSFPTFSKNCSCARAVCSWCLTFSFAFLASDTILYSVARRLASGPPTIHLLSADGSSVTPIAPPSPLITAFARSYAWPMAMAENVRLDLKTTNLPDWNSWKTPGCVCSNDSMSLRWTGSHCA